MAKHERAWRKWDVSIVIMLLALIYYEIAKVAHDVGGELTGALVAVIYGVVVIVQFFAGADEDAKQ